MQDIWDTVQTILGIDFDDLSLEQMLARAFVIYIVALIIIRVGDKRFLGKSTAFDFILGIIFGSIMSRAINGSAPFFPTIAAALMLVMLHWLFALFAFHSDWFGNWIKGHNRLLVKDGEIQWKAMQKSQITEHDLMDSIRLQANTNRLDNVKEARLERSGSISVVKASPDPKVVNVRVEEGVQIVRVEIS